MQNLSEPYFSVVPAKAGIQKVLIQRLFVSWTPAFRGSDDSICIKLLSNADGSRARFERSDRTRVLEALLLEDVEHARRAVRIARHQQSAAGLRIAQQFSLPLRHARRQRHMRADTRPV